MYTLFTNSLGLMSTGTFVGTIAKNKHPLLHIHNNNIKENG